MKNDDLLAALRDWGCDTEGALRRAMGESDFYVTLLRGYGREWDLAPLCAAVESADAAAAFPLAHSAKGVLGNLGLTPLYRPVSVLTDILRTGSCDGAAPVLGTITQRHREFTALLDRYAQ